MNQDQAVNLIQTLGKVLGGMLAAKGIGDSSTTEAGIGFAVAVAAWWYSHRGNSNASIVAAADAIKNNNTNPK